MTKKHSAAKTPKEAPEPQVPKAVEELILDYQGGKYSAIALAALWAKVLRRKEENRHLTASDILDLALRDVLTGSVDWKEAKKAAAELPPSPNGAEAKEKAK